MWENCLYSVNHFNKTLIGQAGSIGGKARQEVGVGQRDWEYSGSRSSLSATPAQTTEEATCKLSHWERYWARVTNIDQNNGLR